MSKNLPHITAAYFRAMNTHNTAVMASCFADGAVVQDEGREYRGVKAVTEWIEASTEKYKTTIEVTDIEDREGKTVVTNQVSGNFAGSPVTLEFHFTLDGEKIAALTIGR